MSDLNPPRLWVRTPWAGPWRSFHRPEAVFSATTVADVSRCLAEVDEAVRRTGHTAAGFVSYEAAAAFGLPVRAFSPDAPPLVWFGLFAPAHVATHEHLEPGDGYHVGPWQASIDRRRYLDDVRRLREEIAAGNTYQVNYTLRLTSPWSGDPRSLAADLDAAQGGRWSALIDTGRHVIASASPELFFLQEGERVLCRPMKGTARRGLSAAGDEALASSLAGSAKNRAENVMVVDMTRNDLGRIARVGSVIATDLYEIERYPAQWQMVSSVAAEVEEPTLPRLFNALFPSGSVTGAPKHSSMQIIRAIEPGPRGVYTGAIGLVEPDRAHFNVAIRTVAIDRDKDTAEFGVGSGIVWDSVDRDEYDECLVKASILVHREPAFELLETIGWTPVAGFALLDGHLARLRSSARYFDVPLPGDDALRAALGDATRDRSTASRVRLLVDRRGRLRCEATDLLAAAPAVLRAVLANEPVDLRDVFLYHKTTRRAVYEEARRRRPDADAVILWNRDREVTEGTEANIIAEIDGRRVTPPVECGLLPGVMRAALLASGDVVEQRVSIDQLQRAGRVWLINSVRGWMNVELAS